jgi:phage-related minor tail protein
MPTIGEGLIKIRSDTADFGKGLLSTISSIGGSATAGFAVVGAAVAGVGVALYKIGSDFQTAYNTIRKTTGATGDQMKGLEDSFKNVAKTSGRSFEDIATAIGQVSARTGTSGAELEGLTRQFLTFSKVTGVDVKDAVNSVTRVMGDWGISTADAGLAMDKLYVASTQTGVGVDRLAEGVVKFGSPMRQLGFSFEDTTALLAKFESEGVNTELVMGSMRIALGKMAKAGESDLPAALGKSIDAIKNTGDAGAAAGLAVELFGARAGPDMAAAIREGRFEVDDLVKAMGNAEGAVSDTAKETATFGGNMALFRNQLKVALEPLATTIFSSINDGMSGVLDILRGFLERLAPAIEMAAGFAKILGGWSDVLVPVALAFATLAVVIKTVQLGIAAYHAALAIAATVQTGFNVVLGIFNALLLANPIVLIVAGIALLIAAVVLLYFHFQPVRDIIDAVWQAMQKLVGYIVGAAVGAFQALQAAASAVFNWLKSNWPLVLGILTGPFGLALALIWKYWDEIKAGAAAAFDFVKSAVSSAISFITNNWQLILGILTGPFGLAVAVIIRHFDSIVDFVRGIPAKIVAALGNVKDLLFGAGQAIVEGLIRGITSKLGAISDAASALAGKVKGFLPFSPAKEGPLSGRGNPFYSGQAIAAALAEGIESALPTVGKAMDDLVTLPPATVDAGRARGGPRGATPANGNGATYVLNIYPQQLDELGVLAAFRRLEMIGAMG